MSDHAYIYPSMDIATVMDNIDEFIIPENQRAVKYLWSKNILTEQNNNYDNKDSWINIGKLSAENAKIFWELANDMRFNNPSNVRIGLVGKGKGLRVPIVPGKGNDTFEAFRPLIDIFGMQDVQKDGYMTVDEFLIGYIDCYRIIRNPEYNPLVNPRYLKITDPIEFAKAYSAYADSATVLKYLKVVDTDKMVKPLEEYLKDFGLLEFYDEEEGKIFYNRQLYEGHMRYKKEAKLLLK